MIQFKDQESSESIDFIKNAPELIKNAPEFMTIDINLLTPFYGAIAKMKRTLEYVCKINNFTPACAGWPTPNNMFYRTSKHLILASFSYPKDNYSNHVVYYLYTPFGEIQLMSNEWFGNMSDDRPDIIQDFFDNMMWIIEDRTDKIKFYQYYNCETKQLIDPYVIDPYCITHTSNNNKYYLITQVEDIELPFSGGYNNDDDVDEDIIVASCFSNNIQFRDDLERFRIVSNGQNRF
uniref:Uncharacterized protein n=1 Tax=viral metagenome TaxID=1070528 RepID=A0A6C0E9P5_9ZZZZ